MCGIAGIFGFSGGQEELAERLAVMNRAMVHRGPDESGTLVRSSLRAGLAVRRLSIVDPENGSQPLFNEDRTVAVVCNGEIYNHRDLRRDLEARGHRITSGSDCAVLPHLYEEQGVDFLRRLNGMFALAVLDMKRHTLLIARDPVGMKHLYWGSTPHGIVFASEARSLFAAGLVDPRPDWSSLGAFFSVGWIQSPHTAYAGLHRLRPGSFVEFGEERSREGRYWVPRYREPDPNRTDESYAEELRGLLDNAVDSHLQADFPPGLLLSGGWDSSLIALYASRITGVALNSYSLRFPDDAGADESHYFRQVASQAGTNSQEIEVRDTDIRDALEPTVHALEEPNGSCPTTLSFLLSQATARGSKLALGGEGADELFAGYDWFRPSRAQRILRSLPSRLIPASLPVPIGPRLARALRFAAAPDEEHAQLSLRSSSSPRRISRFLKSEYPLDIQLGQEPLGLTQSTRNTFRDDLDRKLALDLTGRLADGILFAHDKTAMAHSLEVRMPFLDMGIVEFAHRLPSRLKISGDQMKAVLAPLAADLPADVATRPKQGLHVPSRVFSSVALRDHYREIILETSIDSGLFDHPRLEVWVNQSAARPGTRAAQLWSLCHFCTWWNQFMDGPAVEDSHER
ncbi:MAG: asparagine synthase (glutamine-hydrolyzing) [Xanthomonadales bacterium]|nr:asparagine synthase (glutamine-hydrolyzing) [Gammaproteobacteria bacterium]NNJ79961.1 asparagine synthase (glutamine-hydrolyzing) [Xanthomonadales bacterium]NNL05317.1 asparagine synthase (glutamine-hydrolyzing) [Xanthomonadales bacterium]